MSEFAVPLINKFRPQSFDEMFGHADIIKALKRAMEADTRPHAYLLTGPAGTGKTTTARIIANDLGCSDVIEIDAASHSGIDDMRQLVELGNHMSLTGAGKRAFIVDECFAGSSIVETANGPRPISTIKPGDYVMGAKGLNKVKSIFLNKVPLSRIIQLRLANNKAILCSEDHAFLTKKGWVAAKDLLDVKSVFGLRADIPPSMQILWDGIYEQRRGRNQLRALQTFQVNEKLSRMRKSLPFQNAQLFSSLWQSYGCAQTNGSAFSSLSSFYEVGAAKSSSGAPRFSGSGLSPNAYEQSYAKSGSRQENDSHQNGKWNLDPGKAMARRQWQGLVQRASAFVERAAMQIGICNSAKVGSLARVSDMLQSRFGLSRNKVGNRGGWKYSFKRTGERTRPQERIDAEYIGVESAEIYQPGSNMLIEHGVEIYSIDGCQFAELYDLEVEGHPSYSVEGTLVHNCHALSKPAWQAILKLLEEPPEHLFIMLCTTETAKVPETIKTRCYHVAYRSLKPDEIAELLGLVCEVEEWQVANDVMSAVIQNAGGSPRKALSMMQSVHDVDTREEVGRIIALNEASEPLIELCQLLMRGQYSWVLLQPVIARIDDSDFEDGLIGAGRYIAAALMRSKSEKEAKLAWAILDALTFPTTTYDKKIHFLAAVGRLVFA